MSETVTVRPLTKRQRDVLRVLVAFRKTTGEPPSMRYVARRLSIHVTTVQQHIEALHEKGWLRSPSTAGLQCLHLP